MDGHRGGSNSFAPEAPGHHCIVALHAWLHPFVYAEQLYRLRGRSEHPVNEVMIRLDYSVVASRIMRARAVRATPLGLQPSAVELVAMLGRARSRIHLMRGI